MYAITPLSQIDTWNLTPISEYVYTHTHTQHKHPTQFVFTHIATWDEYDLCIPTYGVFTDKPLCYWTISSEMPSHERYYCFEHVCN